MTNETNTSEQEPDSSANRWKQGGFVLVFAILMKLATSLVVFIGLFQFLSTLIAKSANQKVTDFGSSLAAYVQETALFIAYKSERKPWPFSDWPPAEVAPVAETKPKKPRRRVRTKAKAKTTAKKAAKRPEEES